MTHPFTIFNAQLEAYLVWKVEEDKSILPSSVPTYRTTLESVGRYLVALPKYSLILPAEFEKVLAQYMRTLHTMSQSHFMHTKLYTNAYMRWLLQRELWNVEVKITAKYQPTTEKVEADQEKRWKLGNDVLSKEEKQMFLDYVAECYPQHFPPFYLMVNFGCRPSEVCRIRYKDFKEDNKGRTHLYLMGKTQMRKRSGPRSLHIPSTEVWERCMAHFGPNPYPEQFLWNSLSLGNTQPGLIVDSGHNIPMDYKRADALLEEISREALGRRINLYNFRRSFISGAYEAGADEREIMSAVDHTNVNTTRRYAPIPTTPGLGRLVIEARTQPSAAI